MGTRRHYFRLTPTELEQALRDPAWAESFLDERWSAELDDRGPVAGRRMLDVDKFWTEFDVLLHLAGIPVAVHLGSHRLFGEPVPEWGEPDALGRTYTGATYLTPEEVVGSARLLAPVSLTALYAGIDDETGQAAMAEHGGEWWYADGECAYHDRSYGEFFTAAAAAGEAVAARIA